MAKKKASAVFVDLTAACDTIWHCSLTCKLLCLLPDRHMVRMIMGLVTSCSFTPTPGVEHAAGYDASKMVFHMDRSWLPLLYSMYTYNMPTSVLQKYTYADDLVFMHSAGDWQAVQGVFSPDLVTLAAYLQTWRLKLSWSKRYRLPSI